METLDEEAPSGSTPATIDACDNRSCSHRGGCNADHTMERQLCALPTRDKLALCREFKAEASALFAEGQFRRAQERFRKILVYLDYTLIGDGEDDAENQVNALQATATLNACVCALKMGDLRQCISHANRVLRFQAKHVKALYCRAKARRLLGELGEASEDIEACLRLAPTSRDVHVEAMLLRADYTEATAEVDKLSKAMFARQQPQAEE